MSIYTAHIRSHRAMASALQRQAVAASKDPAEHGIAPLLSRLCWAHQSAADDLEEHERELASRVEPCEEAKLRASACE